LNANNKGSQLNDKYDDNEVKKVNKDKSVKIQSRYSVKNDKFLEKVVNI